MAPREAALFATPELMPRHKVILQSEFPYNISSRCINRDWFSMSMDKVWNIFCEELTRVSIDHEFKIHSFVLMSNHYQLIASTPLNNVSLCMMNFNRRSSRRITRSLGRINETFVGRHFKCVLASPAYSLNACKYNYRNPVTSGICCRVEDYKFSTLPARLGLVRPSMPLIEDTTFISDPRGTLDWLNKTPDPEKLEAVRYGLKRAVFKSKKCMRTNKPILAEDEIL